MIVDPDFMDHWRTGMVADAIQDSMAPIYILRLWAHCQERRSDTFAMPTRGLKAQCKFPGDADLFEAALVDAGFIRRDGDTITVCGWAEKNAALFAAWENGAKGGRPRKEPNKNRPETHGKPGGNPPETHGEPNENPPGTQAKPIREEERREEVSEEANASSSSPGATARPTLPGCPAQDIVTLYHEALPTLPSVRVTSQAREKAIRAFWRWVLTSKRSDGTPRAVGADQALTWIRGYFERASQNDFLMGRTERSGAHAGWACDLDFLLTDRGKKHVIERTGVTA